MRHVLGVGAVAAMVAGFSTCAWAQTYGRVGDVEAKGTAYHVFVSPGDATVQVEVVGPENSGIYEVSEGTTLTRLLVLTGDLALAPRYDTDRRDVTVRLFRLQSEVRGAACEIALELLLTEPEHCPRLADGDLVVVETIEHRGFSWRDGLTITTAVAAVALAVERIFSLTR